MSANLCLIITGQKRLLLQRTVGKDPLVAEGKSYTLSPTLSKTLEKQSASPQLAVFLVQRQTSLLFNFSQISIYFRQLCKN